MNIIWQTSYIKQIKQYIWLKQQYYNQSNIVNEQLLFGYFKFRTDYKIIDKRKQLKTNQENITNQDRKIVIFPSLRLSVNKA